MKAQRPFGLLLVCLVAAGAIAMGGASDLGDLPMMLETRIPAVVQDQLADVERVASLMPGVDRKLAYLVTLPLENYLEDVVLPDNQAVVLHPRAMAWLISREALRGRNRTEIARTLVKSYQKNEYPALQKAMQSAAATGAAEREAR